MLLWYRLQYAAQESQHILSGPAEGDVALSCYECEQYW